MLTFDEIEMLRHALTSEFEQVCYHEGSGMYKYAFLKMTEKLKQMLGVNEHLVDESRYPGEWRQYPRQGNAQDDNQK